MATISKETIPTAITGAFLAGLTALMTLGKVIPHPFAILFPPWAVFITWAGYFAAGGGGKGQGLAVFKKMYIAILWGVIWGFAAGFAMTYWITGLPLWQTVALDGIVIFLVNQPILWGTRYWNPIAYTPAIFYGFAIFFSTYFGGFGIEPGNIYSAFITAYLCALLGPLMGYLQVRFAMIHEVPAPTAPAGAVGATVASVAATK
jgi:hypothetical protein